MRENGGLVLASYGYDALGRRVSRALGNGTSTTYGYDGASRLTALNLNGGGQANATTLPYNPAGQIASRTMSNDAYGWTGAVNADRIYAVNGLNQYTQSGSVVPTYDGRGNLTSAGGATWLYNSKNQLSGANGTYLYYDAAGRLDQVTQSGLAWQWDGSRLVTELQGGGIAKRYVHGAGVDEPIVQYDGAGTGQRRWLDADERGSIVRVSNDVGGVVALNSYDEYGIPGPNNQGRFQYTGQMWMPELGIYHYKARMYSATLGRFLQTDPIGYADGLNLYAYVGGDPINATDPSGTDKACGPGRRLVPNTSAGQVQTSSIGPVSGMRCEAEADEVSAWDHEIVVTGFCDDGCRMLGDMKSNPFGLSNSIQTSFSESPQESALCAVSALLCITVVGNRQPKAFINYSYGGFFSHVAARHFGTDTTFGSTFRPQFQNELSLISLASYAANNSPLRNTNFPGVYRYTANYSGIVGYLQGTATATSLITLIVKDTGSRNNFGQRVFQPVTLYPGAGLP